MMGATARSAASTDRVDRGLTRLIAFGGLALAGYTVPRLIEQWGVLAVWWQLGGALYLVLLACLALGGGRLPSTWLGMLWRAVPALGLALHLSWAWAVHAGSAAEIFPWFWEVEPASVSLLVLWASWPLAVGYAVASPLAVALSAWLAHGEVSAVVLANTPIHLTNLVFVMLFAGIRRELKRVWAFEAEVHAQERRRLQAIARERIQEHTAAVVHDELLSTLAVAMHSVGPTEPSLAAQARRGLTTLAGGQHSPRGDAASVATLAEALRGRIAELAGGVRFTAEPSDTAIPEGVVAAITSAAMEGVRNAIRHADAGQITVTVQANPTGVVVLVEDDGRGFDPGQTGSHGTGLRVSIMARMRQLPGGRAQLDSTPGQGTTIRLSWAG